METSVFVARILGVTYLAFGFGLIFSSSFYKREIPKLVEKPVLLIYGGMASTVLGCAIIQYHNIWTNNWQTAITVIGWIGLLKGVTLLLFPEGYKYYKNTIFHENYILKILIPITFLVGATFAYFGFIH